MARLGSLELSLYGGNGNAELVNPKTWSSSQIFHSKLLNPQPKDPPRTPWGRHMSYGGLFDAKPTLSSSHIANENHGLLSIKGHKHYGSGLIRYPKGYPSEQQYEVTLLRKSNLRDSDELVPRPQTCVFSRQETKFDIPKESSLSSHSSKQMVFPFPDACTGLSDNIEEEADSDSECQDQITLKHSSSRVLAAAYKEKPYCHPKPTSTVVCKAMGSFGRREQVKTWEGNPPCTPNKFPWQTRKIEYSRWFSRHDVIKSFHSLNPSKTPELVSSRGRRPADWHAAVGYCAQ